jgi:UDP-glucose 4-epimerase
MPKVPLILLTGGRGRLASAIHEFQINQGNGIQAFSRTAGGGFQGLDDLLKPGLWEQAGCLLHTAWSTVPLVSERAPATEWETDLPWLARMLRHFGERGGRRPVHFVFFSSGGTVYGNAAPGRSSREDDPLCPKGWHGLAKVQAETLVREACAHYHMPCTILRISNPYGMSSATVRPQGIIPILASCALDGSVFRLWGDGDAEKDYIHITDFNHAVDRVITEGITGTYNLCSGRSHSVKSVIKQIEDITGRMITVIHEPAYDWDVVASRLDNRALCDATGWSPRVSLAEGLRECVDSIRKISPPTKD